MSAGIPLISNIEQKNGGEFWLVDSNAIYGGLYHVSTQDQMNALPEIRLKPGMLCYVSNEDAYYKYKNNEWIKWSLGENTNDIIPEEEIQKMINIFKSDTV